MLHHLTGGRWGDVLRPLLETGIKSLPLMAVLFLPIAVGMKWIYPWTQPEKYLAYPGYGFIHEALSHQHHIWSNPLFFCIRAVIYFVILFILSRALLRQYKLRDEMAMQDPEHNSGPSYRLISGPGIVITCVLVTLFMTDWGMSTQPGWYSTLYGMAALAGEGLSTFAFMIVALLLILKTFGIEHARAHGRGHEPGHEHVGILVSKNDWHDLGNLTFAFTMIWGYLSLSQLIITYSGNLPQETIFYNFRSNNGWQYIGWGLTFLHFVLPFMLLLMRDIKRDPNKLVLVALFVLMIRQLDFYYQVHPSYTLGLKDSDGNTFAQVMGALGWHTVTNLLTPFGIGGLWVAFFAWNLRDRRVLPKPAEEGHHHG
jgi:hypothetical protein